VWHLRLLAFSELVVLCRPTAETDCTPISEASHPQSSCTYQDFDYSNSGCCGSLDNAVCNKDCPAASSTASPSLFQGSSSRQRLLFPARRAEEEGRAGARPGPPPEVHRVQVQLREAKVSGRELNRAVEEPPDPSAVASGATLNSATAVPVPQPREQRRHLGLELLSLVDTIRRRLGEQGLKASRQLSEQVAVLTRTQSGSVMVAAAIVLLIGFLFCLGAFVHAFVFGLKQDKQEPRPVQSSRADVRHVQAAAGPSRPALQQGSSPTPRTMSTVSMKPYPKKQPSAETPRRFLSTDSLAPSSRSMPEEPVNDADGTFLCPELVVPEGSECTLLVPRVSLSGSGVAPVSISDARGVPVFKAVFAVSPVQGRNKQEIKRLVLSSATGDAIFAFCRDTEADSSTGQAGLAIFHHSEAPFGDIRADGPRPANGYSVTSHRGWRLRFRGDPEGRNLNATDDHGRLLAITEAHAPARRSVRIGPLVDAGLIAISVLGIDLLGQGFAESQRL